MTLSAVIRATRGNFRLDVSFDVADGETLAVLGPNGAGKSTILRCLLGLVPLDTGRIVLGDHVLDDTTNNLYVEPENRRVGAVFQDYLLFRHLSVIDNVAFGLRARGAKKESARLTARSHLERFEVEHLADRRPSQLSGGEAQRVALARALAVDPKVLLLDEPLAALDVTTRRTVRDELSLFLSAFGGPRLIVTHDPADARRLADRVLIVEHGSVVQHGSILDVKRDPATPYVAALFGDDA
ncbi:MAG: ATP-binding cassette domain-containing protein [Actinomycetota bacterium]|nr:ATP-binding cassette domain-containing protein [Actinomycetota bacterium]MDA3011868.1 ATP-binding cassette domain-containing protein [Actinomycetota bacterium]MDA3024570.1 ATP-binding cassette domain-containing protein [Actinomycetota bacterium]